MIKGASGRRVRQLSGEACRSSTRTVHRCTRSALKRVPWALSLRCRRFTSDTLCLASRIDSLTLHVAVGHVNWKTRGNVPRRLDSSGVQGTLNGNAHGKTRAICAPGQSCAHRRVESKMHGNPCCAARGLGHLDDDSDAHVRLHGILQGQFALETIGPEIHILQRHPTKEVIHFHSSVPVKDPKEDVSIGRDAHECVPVVPRGVQCAPDVFRLETLRRSSNDLASCVGVREAYDVSTPQIPRADDRHADVLGHGRPLEHPWEPKRLSMRP
mmetsp:Transcript_23683/g.62347  ORF Transcript_23683/g.62347 Transcript_23683/m.62347 type:complete len:270 (-) Transcript_23683:7-816(-)